MAYAVSENPRTRKYPNRCPPGHSSDCPPFEILPMRATFFLPAFPCTRIVARSFPTRLAYQRIPSASRQIVREAHSVFFADHKFVSAETAEERSRSAVFESRATPIGFQTFSRDRYKFPRKTLCAGIHRDTREDSAFKAAHTIPAMRSVSA